MVKLILYSNCIYYTYIYNIWIYAFSKSIFQKWLDPDKNAVYRKADLHRGAPIHTHCVQV